VSYPGCLFLFLFFFQFPDGITVASIPRQVEKDFAKLATLFQGTPKCTYKCGDTLPLPTAPNTPPPKEKKKLE
jgi:hypothetical protein